MTITVYLAMRFLVRFLVAVFVSCAAAAPWAAFDAQYRNGATCSATTDFPVDLTGWQYKGLKQEKDASDVPTCAQKCCDMGPACLIWQFSEHDGCWVGAKNADPYADPDHKYQSRGRNMSPPAPTPPPTPMPDAPPSGRGLTKGTCEVFWGKPNGHMRMLTGANRRLAKRHSATVRSPAPSHTILMNWGQLHTMSM